MESFKQHKKLEIASNFINSIAPEIISEAKDNMMRVNVDIIGEYIDLAYLIAEKLVEKFDE